MTEGKSQVQRLLDLFVFAPAGIAQSAAEEFEKFAEKGRHRVEGQVHTARLVGQFAVQTARSQTRRVLHDAVARVAGGAGPQRSATPAVSRGHEPSPSPAVTRAHSSQDGEGPASNGSATALAIPGYDSLSASQVVQRLDGLSVEELAEVREHELTHRHRRTILSRVDQLLSGARTEQG